MRLVPTQMEKAPEHTYIPLLSVHIYSPNLLSMKHDSVNATEYSPFALTGIVSVVYKVNGNI